MARPTARVLSLLELLQAGGTHSTTELSSQLHVDERTVRRYVEHLNELDIPVESVRGRYGGYRLARHFRMPPLMLTDDEAVAVVWGLLTTARSTAGPSSSLHVQTALAKVRRVLPPRLARRVEAVVDVVDFTAARPDEDEHREGGSKAWSFARPGAGGTGQTSCQLRLRAAARAPELAIRASAQCRRPPAAALPHWPRRRTAGDEDLSPRPHHRPPPVGRHLPKSTRVRRGPRLSRSACAGARTARRHFSDPRRHRTCAALHPGDIGLGYAPRRR